MNPGSAKRYNGTERLSSDGAVLSDQGVNGTSKFDLSDMRDLIDLQPKRVSTSIYIGPSAGCYNRAKEKSMMPSLMEVEDFQ